MFGWYTLQLPSRLQNAIHGVSQKQQGGSIKGAFSMGALSGLVASPCTTAPLAGILTLIAQSGDAVHGFLSLYALSLGMGIPLIGFALGGNKFMPKAGAWMDLVKHAFGFMLLGLAIYFLARILPDMVTTLLQCAFMLSLIGYLYVKNDHSGTSIYRSLRQLAINGLLVLTLLFGWTHLSPSALSPQAMSEQEDGLAFLTVRSQSQWEAVMREAAQRSQPVMVDVYASWCSACIQYEKQTFADPKVKQVLDPYLLVQIDLSRNTEFGQWIQKELSIIGLPAIMFFDREGQALTDARIAGFMDSAQFIEHVQLLSDDKYTKN
jgi:thioredoxin:protein disulfide reductase